MKRVLANIALIVVLAGVLVGYRTERSVTGVYFNSQNYESSIDGQGAPLAGYADSGRVVYFSKTAHGTTHAFSDADLGLTNWTFKNIANGFGLRCTLYVYTQSKPGWLGYADTTEANAVTIHINQNGQWDSEGVPVYGFKFKSPVPLAQYRFATIIARK